MLFLEWEGIIGYTKWIEEVVEQAYDVDLTNRKFIDIDAEISKNLSKDNEM